jgi:hypothetical protein
MTRPPGTRYLVRNARGEELWVPSLAELQALYEGGFLADEDQVRSERADRFVPLGSFPALHGVRERRAESPRKVALLVAALMVLATAIGILLAR